jgi:acyl-coenzyme A thioesterase PaaI-like protein
MEIKAFQDYYPDELSLCYGCGRLNPHGMQIKSYWDGEESVCRFQPGPYHTVLEGYVYGGLIASIIDCHGTGTGAAAMYRAENRPMDSQPPIRCVTAKLQVEYLKPTPMGQLELRGRVKELSTRKAIIAVDVLANGVVCTTGEVIAVRINDEWLQKYLQPAAAS